MQSNSLPQVLYISPEDVKRGKTSKYSHSKAKLVKVNEVKPKGIIIDPFTPHEKERYQVVEKVHEDEQKVLYLSYVQNNDFYKLEFYSKPTREQPKSSKITRICMGIDPSTDYTLCSSKIFPFDLKRVLDWASDCEFNLNDFTLTNHEFNLFRKMHQDHHFFLYQKGRSQNYTLKGKSGKFAEVLRITNKPSKLLKKINTALDNLDFQEYKERFKLQKVREQLKTRQVNYRIVSHKETNVFKQSENVASDFANLASLAISVLKPMINAYKEQSLEAELEPISNRKYEEKMQKVRANLKEFAHLL